VTRTLGINLHGTPAGECALALSARDEKTGDVVTRMEPFSIVP
jgi:hypothetical protein